MTKNLIGPWSCISTMPGICYLFLVHHWHRFYYEREGQFTPDQLIQIKQSSLSRLICDNADDIDRVPAQALVLQDSSQFVSCADIPTVDLFPWKDCTGEIRVAV